MNLKNKAITGFGWMFLLRIISRSIIFIKVLTLARLLDPSIFGLFSLSTIFINALEALAETGIIPKIMQLGSKFESYVKTIWVIYILRGLILTIISLSLAKVTAIFFNESELYYPLILLSFLPLIKGLQNPRIILLQKNLTFHKELQFRTITLIVDLFSSVFLSIFFHSIYPLIFGLIISSIIELFASYIFIKPSFKGKVSKTKALELFHFGKWLTLGGIFTYLGTQIDNIIIGKLFGTHILGLYDLAYEFANIAFNEVTDVISRTLLPIFSKIRNEEKKLQRAFIKTEITVFFTSGFITLLLVFFAKPIISLTLGSQWSDSAYLLQILSVLGFLRGVNGPTGPLFLVLGKSKVLSMQSMLHFFFLAIFLFPFSQLYGLTGAAWSVVISYLLALPVPYFYVIKYLRKADFSDPS